MFSSLLVLKACSDRRKVENIDASYYYLSCKCFYPRPGDICLQIRLHYGCSDGVVGGLECFGVGGVVLLAYWTGQ